MSWSADGLAVLNCLGRISGLARINRLAAPIQTDLTAAGVGFRAGCEVNGTVVCFEQGGDNKFKLDG